MPTFLAKTITVTAENEGGRATATHTLTIMNVAVTEVNIEGPEIGAISTTYAFTASISPATVSLPITYTWSPEPNSGQGASVATYRWDTGGIKTINVEVQYGGDLFTDDHAITFLDKRGVLAAGVAKLNTRRRL